MAEITAAMVKELRERTDLPMMDCKKALTETGGDMQKAEELLRIKSGAKASKAASRIAAEGVIAGYLSGDAKLGALVEVNCETDFVAKNDDFVAFAKGLAEAVAKNNPADVEALSKLSVGGENVEAKRQALIQKIGENMSIRRFARVQTDAKIAQYMHGVKIGVLVEFEGDDEVGKDLAMHIAFAKPKAMSKSELDPQLIETERRILSAQAAESGKPADIVAKMVEGGINKYLAANTLMGQGFVRDDKLTVEKMLASRGAKLRGYKFFVVGEGIEKKVTDFAAEVAAQAAGSNK